MCDLPTPPPSSRSPNLDIRKKCLDITLDLISPRNIGEVIHVLKKEVSRTASGGGDDDAAADRSNEYHELLVAAIHSCAVKFPEVAETVVPVLMDFLGDTNQSSAVDVILFVREIIHTYGHLQPSIMDKTMEMFPSIQGSRVLRIALWLMGEYCASPEEVARAFQVVKGALEPFPLVSAAAAAEETPTSEAASAPMATGRTTVLADGTYATQAVPQAAAGSGGAGPGVGGGGHKLRELILGGDYFLAVVVGSALAKLAVRSRQQVPVASIANAVVADVMSIIVQLLKAGKVGTADPKMDADSAERLSTLLVLLSSPTPEVSKLLLEDCRQSFSDMTAERKAQEAADMAEAAAAKARPGVSPPVGAAVQPDVMDAARPVDALLNVRQLKGSAADAELDDDEDDVDVVGGLATGDKEDFGTRLKRVTQLTVRPARPGGGGEGGSRSWVSHGRCAVRAQGLSDPVYAEAFVTVHQYDIVLDMLIINQSSEPMANLTLELATVGDLKLCERPQAYTLGPGEQRTIRANIKVSSTETGILFGSIVFDATGPVNAERTCVVLQDIHIDIMDYISPASCTDLAFRAMWAEFEWENKVSALHRAVHPAGEVTAPSPGLPPCRGPGCGEHGDHRCARVSRARGAFHQHEVPHAHFHAGGPVRVPRCQPLREVQLWRGGARQRVRGKAPVRRQDHGLHPH